jgi:tyrosinase
MNRSWNRRQFVLAGGAAATAAVTAKSWINPTSVKAATFTRMDVGNLTAASSQITSYAKAITAMKALPSTDPRSWSYQAAIHGTTAPCPCLTSWNTCEHGTEFFWSWHRMYLYYFEKIVRRMSGDYGWALPYWNWQLASESQLPSMFRDKTSPLYTVNRDANMNSGSGSLPPGDVNCSFALGDLAFTSAVEDIQNPHGNVHEDVGGWMANIQTSAQDPIFYFHHSNVDRLWDIWLAQGGGRSDPTGDATWKGKTYTFFDENGTAVTMNDCDVLRAAQQLNYTYQNEPAQVNEYCVIRIKIPPWLLQEVIVFDWPLPGPGPVEVNSDRLSVPVELGDKIKDIQAVAASKTDKLIVVLDSVQVDTQPGVTYQVYLGLPEGDEPTTKSPYYLGTFSMFGMGIKDQGPHGSMPATFRFPAGPAVTALLKENRKPSLTIVPSGILIDGKPSKPKAKAPLHIGAIRFSKRTEARAPISKVQPKP